MRSHRLPLDVYVITDRQVAGERDIIAIAEAAIAGGASLLQLREKDISTAELVRIGAALRDLTRRTNRLLIVNDRVDVALAVEADGVHLGQDDLPLRIARKILGPDKIIGGSAGNLDEARICLEGGADYIGVGPIYRTQTKGDAGEPVGPALIRAVRDLTDLPLVAIGGLNAANAAEAVRAGADGVAVVQSVVGAADPAIAARQIAEAVARAKQERRV